MEKVVVKMGLTPSNAPFRMANLRTFLYIYSFLMNNHYNQKDCKLIFQIDDTDPKKRLHSNEEIIDFYKKIGILNNELPYIISFQANNKNICDKFYNELYNKGFVEVNSEGVSYFCIKKYVELFGREIIMPDLILGNIVFDVEKITRNNNFSIRRSDGSYLYNFASCVDNFNLGLTHLIRGKNKISSGAFQIILCKSLGIEIPKFIHLPMLLQENGTNEIINSRSLFFDTLNEGYDYMPTISYLLSSGYGDSEILYTSLQNFVAQFDIKNIHKKDGQFSFNIYKKICNRFRNIPSYEDYEENIKKTALLLGRNIDSKIIEIGFKHKLTYAQIYEGINEIYNDIYDDISDIDSKLLQEILKEFMNGTSLTELPLKFPNTEKRLIYNVIRWFYIGHKSGRSCAIIKDIFDTKDGNYEKKIQIVESIIKKDERI